MVDFTFLRKKRVRKVALIIGTISLAGAVVVGAVAALGQHAAPMTVKLNNSNVSLGLTTEEASDSYQAFLIGSDAGKSIGYTEYYCSGLPDDSVLDSEISNGDESSLTSDKLSFKYYKYTFYLTNTGEQDAEYEVSMNINRNTSDTKEFDLSSILRVRVYENSDLSQHSNETFAKAKSYRNEQTGELEYTEELVSYDIPGVYATKFIDSKTVMKREGKIIHPKEKVRYTFVMWLEGYDHDSDNVKAPKFSSLALGVNISAHEG